MAQRQVEKGRTERRTVQLELHDMAHGGEAVGRLDNKVVFASFGLPDEVVEVEVYSEKKDFLRGNVTGVLEPSPHRVEPRCPYFGQCGGCQWQHVDYQKQIDLKRQVVIDQMRRVGRFANVEVQPTIGSDTPWHYRNHARFSVGRRQGDVGFTRAGTHQILRVEYCHLMHPAINEVLALVQGKPQGARRLHQIMVRYGVHTGQLLISPKLDIEGFPLESGQAFLEERLLGKTFRVSAASFFQVNTLQAEVMARKIVELLHPSAGDTVVDAYCGVGTFGLLLADHAGKVIGIEDSAAAIRNAQHNAQGVHNVEFVDGATEKVLHEVAKPGALVILDPPRQGCRPEVIESLAALRPRRIVYVSCDPVTLARDLRLLVDRGFALRHIQPIDMFPQTYHIECVALLEDGAARGTAHRAQSECSASSGSASGVPTSGRRMHKLVLASGSPRRQEIMRQLGLDFVVQVADVEEVPLPGEKPPETARRLALAKASAAAASLPAGLAEDGATFVVAADTIVVDDRILGKPSSEEEARRMLRLLRGRAHQVITGVAVENADTRERFVSSVTTTVWMRNYSDAEIEEYVRSGEPMDKAGAYAIQSTQIRLVDRIEGCYLNVVGLPACEMIKGLEAVGHPIAPTARQKLAELCRECLER